MELETQIVNILTNLEYCEKTKQQAVISDLDTLNIIHEALLYYLEEVLIHE